MRRRNSLILIWLVFVLSLIVLLINTWVYKKSLRQEWQDTVDKMDEYINFDLTARTHYEKCEHPFEDGVKKSIVRPRPDILSCHRNPSDRSTLPNILRKRPNIDNYIFFLETSCLSSKAGKIILHHRRACAVESAALANPNTDIHVMVTAPGVVMDTGDLNDEILNSITETYKNVKFNRIDIEEYFKYTPVNSLLKYNILQDSVYPTEHLSDILRYVTMWRFGGTYMDSDVITLRSFENIEPNFSGLEYHKSVGAGVLNFNRHGLAHKWMNKILKYLSKYYLPECWSDNANGAITALIEQICKTDRSNLVPTICKHFTIYPHTEFYPIAPWDMDPMFNVSEMGNVMGKLKHSRAFHTWNNYIDIKTPVKGQFTPYEALFQKYCPVTYQLLPDGKVF